MRGGATYILVYSIWEERESETNVTILGYTKGKTLNGSGNGAVILVN